MDSTLEAHLIFITQNDPLEKQYEHSFLRFKIHLKQFLLTELEYRIVRDFF